MVVLAAVAAKKDVIFVVAGGDAAFVDVILIIQYYDAVQFVFYCRLGIVIEFLSER